MYKAHFPKQQFPTLSATPTLWSQWCLPRFTEASTPDKAKTLRKPGYWRLDSVIHKEEVMETMMRILKRVELFGEYVDRWGALGNTYIRHLKIF